MTIKDWPQQERPREKLLLRGATALTDAELLAIFLQTGAPGRSAVEVGRDLLTQFGNLAGILGASQEQFCAAKGLGPAKFALLQAVLEIGRRHWLNAMDRSDALTSPDATRQFLAAHLGGLPHEVFACL
ncbi:MAG: UPF0758 domain-containing protein, partial [Pseudomonadota bacterium]